ncbi:MAG: uridine kinase [Firmicutes bacterium]|uniref:Uridine kinase n=1 Tax=Candidatus Alloenteromonas pullistercoris TaxID=2840785 RepID=A0A9D9GW86_9FIRM|nr:uridine kinase [Candidatus Enteromonas pullistercoris]
MEENSMTHLVAIVGGSGSGKTFISRALRDNLPYDSASLAYDCYYKDQSHLLPEQREQLNYDSPSMLDESLFLSHLQALKRGESIALPQYDFATHTRSHLTRPFAPKEVVIVEGIMVMQLPKEVYDYVIYVDAEPDVRLARRLLRDLQTRGRTPESVVKQYLSSVKPMHARYVEKAKEKADYVFYNDENNGVDMKQMAEVVSAIKGIVEKDRQ